MTVPTDGMLVTWASADSDSEDGPFITLYAMQHGKGPFTVRDPRKVEREDQEEKYKVLLEKNGHILFDRRMQAPLQFSWNWFQPAA